MADIKITGPLTDLERRYLSAMDSMVMTSHQALAVFYAVHGVVDKDTYTRDQVFQETGRVLPNLLIRGLVHRTRGGLYALTEAGENLSPE